MATLPELCRQYTRLGAAEVAHLQGLVGSWGMLSDLCFSDLLLFVPVTEPKRPGAEPADRFVAVGQVRPTTAQTLHRADLVGQLIEGPDRPVVARAWHLGSIVEGEVAIPSRGERGRLVCIPVRWRGELIAILTRESALSVGRRPGELERVYVEVFDRLARMIANGDFPFPSGDELIAEAPPRVGDGVLVLDSTGRVDYASPNAVNALHRVGTHTSIDGVRLEEVGLEQSAVKLSYATRLPATEEVMRGGDVALVLRCIPLLDHGRLTGSLVLLRDVTELRQRDRLLLSKDAAIREVHHRVKNNLQTISSLLRLQARRVSRGEARKALEESERRVRSIALVHEILSRETKDQVDFGDILPSLMRMAEDLAHDGRAVKIEYQGDPGSLPAGVATPLAVVLTELLQNAAEHGIPGTDDAPAAGEGPNAAPLRVAVNFSRRPAALDVEVRDDGVGLPPGFTVESTPSLGLSIVRGLVESQMGGTITMRSDSGTVVDLHIPVDHADEDPGRLLGT
jgi:two-component system, sensor histidine kinase PdtaS